MGFDCVDSWSLPFYFLSFSPSYFRKELVKNSIRENTE